MNTSRFSPFVATALLICSIAAFAHHGTAGFYDKNKIVKVEGVVKEFRWRNPHSGLFLIVKDASGKELTYAIEMGSPAALSRSGYSRYTFKPGDAVVAEVYPSYGSVITGEADSNRVWVNGKPAATRNPTSAEE